MSSMFYESSLRPTLVTKQKISTQEATTAEAGHWLLLHISMSELHDQIQPFISANTSAATTAPPR